MGARSPCCGARRRWRQGSHDRGILGCRPARRKSPSRQGRENRRRVETGAAGGFLRGDETRRHGAPLLRTLLEQPREGALSLHLLWNGGLLLRDEVRIRDGLAQLL